jgi:ferrous iron transport protein B
LTALLVLSVLVTLFASWILSKTLLKGISSSFTLELPPFRRPKFGEVMVRSVLDRTLFVLGRSVCIAVPAGALVWILANTTCNGMTILQYLSDLLEPIGSFLGMDGVLLLAFVLGSPANELVLPIAFMTYMNQNTLTDLQGFETIRLLLMENHWPRVSLLYQMRLVLMSLLVIAKVMVVVLQQVPLTGESFLTEVRVVAVPAAVEAVEAAVAPKRLPINASLKP